MEKITVLVVEDEMKLLKTLSDFLTINKYTVYQASDGLNAIQEFNAHQEEIDIILLDVMLPFMDGYEVLKQIRLSSNVPVIMLTAKEEVDPLLISYSIVGSCHTGSESLAEYDLPSYSCSTISENCPLLLLVDFSQCTFQPE